MLLDFGAWEFKLLPIKKWTVKKKKFNVSNLDDFIYLKKKNFRRIF